jgi:hypothetical protein
MLVSVKEDISKPLCSLFNKSLREKVFPSDWKIAHVIPLFKMGTKNIFTSVMKIWQDSIIVVQLGNRAKIFVQNIG